jgi:pimeloyl-ACP methyl ester carboxylesterase
MHGETRNKFLPDCVAKKMEKAILYQNKKIFYATYGTGKPVMFVHGFGEDGSLWKNQTENLKNKFKLIVPDLPGSGQSEMIDDMSMEGMAEVLHSIIHKENIDTCTVIGHSMGGYITLALAEKYWNHVNAFGLFHSTAYADSEEKKAIRKKGIEFISQHGAFEFLKTITPSLFSPGFKKEKPGFINEFIAGLKGFSAEALVSYYEAMMQRPGRIQVLKNVKIPVLFIMGEQDNAVPLPDTLQQCHLPEKCYIHILKKSGHMGMMEEADNANRILEEFLLQT